MSERVRTAVSLGPQVGAPSPADVRRQLEGRVEVVEASRERYAALESLLSGGRWKRRLRGQPEALRAVLRHEPAFHEAQDRIQRRAQADHWPEHSQVLVTLREVGALRSRLEALVRKRLGELAPVSGAPSLVEELTRLEGLVFQSIPLELAPGEVRLLEGDSADLWFVLQVYASVILGLLASRFGGGPGAIVLLVLLVANIVHGVLRSGKYWLTSERLVWKPHTGEPVQISAALHPRGWHPAHPVRRARGGRAQALPPGCESGPSPRGAAGAAPSAAAAGLRERRATDRRALLRGHAPGRRSPGWLRGAPSRLRRLPAEGTGHAGASRHHRHAVLPAREARRDTAPHRAAPVSAHGGGVRCVRGARGGRHGRRALERVGCPLRRELSGVEGDPHPRRPAPAHR